jgi:hypothetical protein
MAFAHGEAVEQEGPMGIPEKQLETWSRRGAITTSANTRDAIYTALDLALSEAVFRDYEVYLQGSYRNHTNIIGESDVDIVIQLNSTYQSNYSGLTADRVHHYESLASPATYHWSDFNKDVVHALESAFGSSNVQRGTKCIKVAGNGSTRRDADVVVALHYRDYRPTRPISAPYVDGIVFYARSDFREIINYPKPHYENGVAKSTSTWDRFKPTVRVFKNMRNKMIDNRYITKDVAPSYFLQCLLYNAPDGVFTDSHGVTILEILQWYMGLSPQDLAKLYCQNGQTYLFGATPE